MSYKGIIFDVDGTAVPLGAVKADDRLRQSIRNAQATIALAAATGRSFGYAHPVFQSLGLTCPSIIMGGSAIIDPITDEIVWGNPMEKSQSDVVFEVLPKYQATVRFSTNPVQKNELWDRANVAEPIYTIWVDEMKPDAASKLTKEIVAIPGVIAHSAPSWLEGLVDVHITHAEATKEHAVHVLIEKLGLQSVEVIGVGDSGNDVPIFRAVGHKVAMENGTAELKALADEIAPPLEEGGLAHIIDKYSV